MLLAALVIFTAVVVAVAIASTVRYRRVVRRPGKLPIVYGGRKLP